MNEWQDFFDKFGNVVIDNGWHGPTCLKFRVEDMYRAFASRIKSEMDSSNKGRNDE